MFLEAIRGDSQFANAIIMQQLNNEKQEIRALKSTNLLYHSNHGDPGGPAPMEIEHTPSGRRYISITMSLHFSRCAAWGNSTGRLSVCHITAAGCRRRWVMRGYELLENNIRKN